MAFFNKVGNILRQTVSKHINHELAAANPSIFQMIRYMSSSKLFVGGLAYASDDMSLREAFSAYGDVQEARVIMDRETGRSRGFGFVTYSEAEAASAAIQALDQKELHGRVVRVNYANDRPQGGGGYGGGYGRGGGYGGSGGGYGGGTGYGGNNYGSGGYGSYSDTSGAGGFGSGGYGGNSAGGYFGGESQNSGAAAGTDSFTSGSANTGNSFAAGGDSNFASGDGGQVEGNYRDNDEADNFATRA